MTILEQRFMDRVPVLLTDLISEIKKLNKKVEELNNKLNEKGE